jgi:hypothetical protein
MAGVIKEWRCSCGDFESDLPICPACGACDPFVTRIFTKAPAFKSDRTKFNDDNLKQFTDYYGLADYTNNLSTKHEKDYSDTWKPTTDIVNNPALAANGGEAALIKSIAKDAAKKIANPILAGRDK